MRVPCTSKSAIQIQDVDSFRQVSLWKVAQLVERYVSRCSRDNANVQAAKTTLQSWVGNGGQSDWAYISLDVHDSLHQCSCQSFGMSRGIYQA